MSRIFTFKKNTLFFTVLSLAVCSNLSAYSQTTTPTCTPTTVAANCQIGVTQNFDNATTYASTGFSGADFFLDQTGSNKFLRSTAVSFGPTKTLSSSTFIAPAVNGTIALRFDLGGNANITSYTISAYTANGVVPLCASTTSPNTSGGGLNCFTFNTPANLAGQPFRFIFTFTISGSVSQTITFDNFGTNVAAAGAPLPVSFIGFEAKPIANGNQLQWKVGTETNVAAYEIERSTNGNSFTKAGRVEASGQSSYTFTDFQSASGTVFYRIKSVDVNGAYKYSMIISLKNGKFITMLRAFPLPAQNLVTLHHAVVNKDANINISTVDGRLVKAVKPSTGSVETKIDLTALKSGMYVIRFNNGNDQIETLKLVKQ